MNQTIVLSTLLQKQMRLCLFYLLKRMFLGGLVYHSLQMILVFFSLQLLKSFEEMLLHENEMSVEHFLILMMAQKGLISLDWSRLFRNGEINDGPWLKNQKK